MIKGVNNVLKSEPLNKTVVGAMFKIYFVLICIYFRKSNYVKFMGRYNFSKKAMFLFLLYVGREYIFPNISFIVLLLLCS